MTVLVWIISATVLVSLISLVGIFTLLIKRELLNKILILLVGFAAGGLIGGAFLHLLPEASIECPGLPIFIYTTIGFVAFFLLERYFHWRHCHSGECSLHTFTYLNLIGDSIHNFIDGLVIATSFIADIRLGIATTSAIVFHEIPQEIGDFGILIYGGFSKTKALMFNFISALSAIFGAIIGYFVTGIISNFSVFLIPFTAGGFIYIAASDLIPELHKEGNNKKSFLSLTCFLLGLLFMGLTRIFGG